MTNLVGLAFTTPAIAVMVIDRAQFRVHFYQNKPAELHAFLQEADDRLPVVLVDSAAALQRIAKVEGVHSFLLSDDPRVISEIQGAVLLDAKVDKYSGFQKVMITPETLNAALAKSGSFSFTQSVLDAMSSLREDVSLRELVVQTAADKRLEEDFVSNVCLYAVGLLQKRSWVSRVQKPALNAGVSVERLAELEKFIETAPSAEMLWRAYYDHAECGVPLADAVAAFEADEKDMEYVISHVGAKKGLKYARDPKDKPLVLRKKRKVRKLKSLTPQGSSMDPTKKIDQTATENDMAKSATGLDLNGLLAKIDKSTGSSAFSRAACAHLCGLTDGHAFGGAKRQAVNNGALKKDVVTVSRFVKEDPASEGIWKAFCYHAYYVGVTPADAATKFGVELPHLHTVLKYKPMGLVFDFARWPEELER